MLKGSSTSTKSASTSALSVISSLTNDCESNPHPNQRPISPSRSTTSSADGNGNANANGDTCATSLSPSLSLSLSGSGLSSAGTTSSSELVVLVDESTRKHLPNYNGVNITQAVGPIEVTTGIRKRTRATSTGSARILGFRPVIRSAHGHAQTSESEVTTGQPAQHKSASRSVDLKFVKRFMKIHYLLFSRLNNNGSSLSSWLFILLLLLCLLNEYIIYHVGLVPSKYYKVLNEKDLDQFWTVTLRATGLIVAVALVKSTKQFVQKLLTAGWRRILTKTLHNEYFTSLHYFKLNVLDHQIDNPDQRMTQDVDKFTSIYCDILPKLIMAPFLVGYYSYDAFTKAGWQGPSAVFGFFAIGAIFNRLLMGPVVRYVIKQEKYEGDFRFIHMLVRVNSESIAFHGGGQTEREKTDQSADRLIKTQYRLYLKQYFLNISINLFDYFGSILSYLLLALPIFSGVYNDKSPADLSSIISENSFVTMYLIFQFTSLVDISTQFAEVTGVSHRIGELIERLQGLNAAWKDIFGHELERKPIGNAIEFDFSSSLNKIRMDELVIPVWTLHKISFNAPGSDELIIRDLSMTINTNESILIVGPSSAGKSSLFRILRGLWPISPGHGSIEQHFRPLSTCFLSDPQLVFYSPQKSYLTAGSIRDQIIWPLRTTESSPRFKSSHYEANWMREYLAKLELTHILERVGDDLNAEIPRTMYDSLSPGEVQRICALRIFYHQPLIAFLDEATSALPTRMEAIIYEECQRLRVATVSVGHRETLRRYHEKLLVLDGVGGWELHEIGLDESD